MRKRAIDPSAVAQILPDTVPTWHVVRTLPGRQNTAAERLADHRFGIYLPVEDRWHRTELVGQRPLFPGYVFVFLWGLGFHAPRIRMIAGVDDFLVNGAGVPVTVADRIIDQVRDIEWNSYLNGLPRSFFRPRRGQAIAVRRWTTPNYGFGNPDPGVRVGALHRALGL